MANTRTPDVLRNYKFEVEITGVATVTFTNPMGFSTVSGLSEEVEVIEYREGNRASYPIKIPGQTSVGDVTFERGVTSGADGIALSDWFKSVKSIMDVGEDTTPGVRATVKIRVKDESATEGASGNAAEWTLREAWPMSLEIGDLDAGASDVLIETMVIVAETMVRTTSGGNTIIV